MLSVTVLVAKIRPIVVPCKMVLVWPFFSLWVPWMDLVAAVIQPTVTTEN